MAMITMERFNTKKLEKFASKGRVMVVNNLYLDGWSDHVIVTRIGGKINLITSGIRSKAEAIAKAKRIAMTEKLAYNPLLDFGESYQR